MDTGDQLADEGMVRAADRAGEAWQAAAASAVLRTGVRYPEGFTTDEVWRELLLVQPEAPPDPRALGATMRALSRFGTIKATDLWRKSTRTICHGRPVRVWQLANSAVYEVLKSQLADGQGTSAVAGSRQADP